VGTRARTARFAVGDDFVNLVTLGLMSVTQGILLHERATCFPSRRHDGFIRHRLRRRWRDLETQAEIYLIN
jgi:hypothetical protein